MVFNDTDHVDNICLLRTLLSTHLKSTNTAECRQYIKCTEIRKIKYFFVMYYFYNIQSDLLIKYAHLEFNPLILILLEF